jgi:hypothetical protein
MVTVNNQTIPPSPETRAERMEAQIYEIQEQINKAYTWRDREKVGSPTYILWDEAIDKLLKMKDDIRNLFKKDASNGN